MSSVARNGGPIPWERFPRYIAESLRDWIKDAESCLRMYRSDDGRGFVRVDKSDEFARMSNRIEAHREALGLIERTAGEFASGAERGDVDQ